MTCEYDGEGYIEYFDKKEQIIIVDGWFDVSDLQKIINCANSIDCNWTNAD